MNVTYTKLTRAAIAVRGRLTDMPLRWAFGRGPCSETKGKPDS
jgi:hypothetical protein